jgi:hypothetical protein
LPYVRRESAKDVLAAAFMFIVSSLMVDQIDADLHWWSGKLTLAMGVAALIAYYWLRNSMSSAATARKNSRDVLIVALTFSTGVIAGGIRAFGERWDWSNVGLIVPAFMAWFCFKVLFRVPANAGVPPKSSESA